MHSWFTQKLNEMLGLAHYCRYPILKAHLVLTQQAVDEIYNKRQPDTFAMDRILSLLVDQAENNNDSEVAHHLRRALRALHTREMDHANVVEVDFESTPMRRRTQSGA